MLESLTETPALSEAHEAAEVAGLRHVSDERPGIRRRRAGRGFIYFHPNGARIADSETLSRIKSLAVPPAWKSAWICPSKHGHIQATGRDAKGRKQYRYHPDFRAVREIAKFEHILEFARSLPKIRTTIQEHMSLRGLTREKVLATVVHLLETTLIRIGNDEYARQNDSYGLTTLRNNHVAVGVSQISFRFTGKSGKQWSLKLRDRRVAKIIRACQELPGQELLQYLDDEGKLHAVTSGDVNDYLRSISGRNITAKDFRTWAGTLMAAKALHELPRFDSAAQAKRNLRDVIKRVSDGLGNTPTVCRKCYVHPYVLTGYLERTLVLRSDGGLIGSLAGLAPDEAALLALLGGDSD